ncbi:MAG: 2-C-methyl-D-erythritol 4-phosphate cytidylyltransferase [Bacteroidales bacterium]|nr:2-C-methyl-D-erythritol 4-phosphate cytidylyltransferase [Bacteroidales bacterium]
MAKTVAVILAGGSGVRFGADKPKQFLEIDGRALIEYTIDAFEKHALIDEIAIVTRADYIDWCRDIVVRNAYKKVKRILPGGKERYHSSLAAIEVYADEDKLIFHDAVRPFVSERIISDCVEALKHFDAVDVAVKTVDTIIQVGEDNCITSIPPRPLLRNGQTPQCFKRAVIRRAYDLALQDPGFRTTDDCGVVVRYLPDVPVYVVEGEYSNMKLTNYEDLAILQKYWELLGYSSGGSGRSEL